MELSKSEQAMRPVALEISMHSEFDTGTISGGEVKTCTVTNDDSTDNIPPSVLDYQAGGPFSNPLQVDKAAPGGTRLEITAHLSDNVAVEGAGIFVQDDCGCGQGGFFKSIQLSLASGTPQDGIWKGTFTFPDNIPKQPTERQFYQVGGSVRDTAGNVEGLPLTGVELIDSRPPP